METLQRRLRQRVPVFSLQLSNYLPTNPANGLIIVTPEQQTQLLETIQEISQHNAFYSKMFVKRLVEALESNRDLEIIDELYESLYELLPAQQLSPTEHDTVSYTLIPSETCLKDDKRILIRESPNLISGLGTTGLRTWEASFFLAPYLVSKLYDHEKRWEFQDDFKDKVIMELGCGTGLVGLSLFKYFDGFKKIILTDGDSQLLDNISHNLKLNDISLIDRQGAEVADDDTHQNKEEEKEESCFISNNNNNNNNNDVKNLEIGKLWWGEDDLPKSEINTIVASDVTYDSSAIPYLAGVIAESMSQDNEGYGKVDVAYVAAAIRNEVTSKEWEYYLDMGMKDGIWRWVVIETKAPVTITTTTAQEQQQQPITESVSHNNKTVKSNPIWFNPGTPEIKLYRIERVLS